MEGEECILLVEGIRSPTAPPYSPFFYVCPLVGRMKGETEAVISLSFIYLSLINQRCADPSLDPTPNGRNDLLPIGRLIEQLYHKSFESAVESILN